MLDKIVNRQRVARCRKKMFAKGVKSLTICLNTETLEMLKSIRDYLGEHKKTSKIITLAVRTLYEKLLNEHEN